MKHQINDTVWDFATENYHKIVNITYEPEFDTSFYELDSTVLLTAEYPSPYRNEFEVGEDPDSPHGTIYHSNTLVSLPTIH